MGQTCCKPPSVHARIDDLLLMRPGQPRPVRPIPNADAQCFAPTRAKLWELPSLLHCSVIGTCLSTRDLRKVLTQLDASRATDTDHELHGRAVGLAGQNTPAAKRLQKLLDTAHDLAIRQFARVDSEDGVRRVWQEAADRGDIPGPYWAVLTHPATSCILRNDAFGHVHMLSHLVGAANRADIRRLTELEHANATLTATLDRQQDQLEAALAERDRAVRDLQSAAKAACAPKAEPADDPALRQRIDDLERRLEAEAGRRHAAEARSAGIEQAMEQHRQACVAAQADRSALLAELVAAEAALLTQTPNGAPATARLDGQTLLYVGGRPHQIAALRSLSAEIGARLDHHDGGVDEQIGLLCGLVGRADLVLFPVDCISHEAALAIKRLCRQAGKPFVPLRSAGQGAFLTAIAKFTTPASPLTAAA